MYHTTVWRHVTRKVGWIPESYNPNPLYWAKWAEKQINERPPSIALVFGGPLELTTSTVLSRQTLSIEQVLSHGHPYWRFQISKNINRIFLWTDHYQKFNPKISIWAILTCIVYSPYWTQEQGSTWSEKRASSHLWNPNVHQTATKHLWGNQKSVTCAARN